MKYSDIQIERAKIKFFSDMMLEELSDALYGEGESSLNGVLSAIEKESDKTEKELLIDYIFSEYNWDMVLEGLNKEHDGDCIKKSNTCIRCFSEGFF
jgi:hypothetical protein